MQPVIITDPASIDPTQIAGALTAVTAAGAGVTGLTEICKLYLDEDRFPPPFVCGIVAALFTAAWFASQPTVRLADTFAILMTWFALFNIATGVYRVAKMGADRKAKTASRAVVTRREHDALLAEKDWTIDRLSAQIRPGRSISPEPIEPRGEVGSPVAPAPAPPASREPVTTVRT